MSNVVEGKSGYVDWPVVSWVLGILLFIDEHYPGLQPSHWDVLSVPDCNDCLL